MYGVDVSVDFQQSSHGALINDPGVVEDVMEKAGEVFDPSEFTHVEAMMLGEDFCKLSGRNGWMFCIYRWRRPPCKPSWKV